MKKLLLATLLLPALAHGDTISVGGQWRGLNNADASILISDNESQDCQNVDLTDMAYGVKKRSGTAQFKTIGTSTWAVRGGYFFRDAGGNDEIVHANGQQVLKSVNGSAYSAFITTDTAGSYYDFTDSNGFLYRANSNRDEINRYNGTTLTYYPSHPKGNQIEALPNRLAISGTTANPNCVDFSKKGDFTTFTTGIQEADPFQECFGLPGQNINAMKWADDRLIIWTKDTTFLWSGDNQFNGVIQQLDTSIGTNQPNSVIRDLGVTYWQSQNGHFYSYDNDVIRWISRSIAGTISGLSTGESKNWETTTQSDFNSGTVGNGLTTSYSSGDLLLSTGTLVDDFSDGDYTSNPVWTKDSTSGGSVSVVSNKFRLSNTGASGPLAYTAYSASTGSWKVNFTINQTSSEVDFSISTGVPVSLNHVNWTYWISLNTSGTQEVFRQNTSLGTFSMTLSTGTNHNLELNRTDAGIFHIYIDNVNRFSFTDTNYSSFTYLWVGGGTSSPPGSIDFDDFYFYPGTGTYQSQAFNIGTSITSWGTFDIGQTLSDGIINYAVYADSDSSITTTNVTSFVSSQTITSGSIPSFSTSAYLTWTAIFSRTISTQTPTLNNVIANWFEGNITRTHSVVDKDHRILWSVAEATQTVPNITLIYDPKYDTWLKYTVPFDAPTKVGDSIYYGGVSTGVVYKWPSGNTDNGSAFTAFWKSKDFIVPDPYVEKDFSMLSFIAKTQSGSNLDMTYTVNMSSSVTYNTSLTDANGNSYVRSNQKRPAAGTFGTFFNWKFGNDDADAPFEVYTVRFDAKPRPWRVLP